MVNKKHYTEKLRKANPTKSEVNSIRDIWTDKVKQPVIQYAE